MYVKKRQWSIMSGYHAQTTSIVRKDARNNRQGCRRRETYLFLGRRATATLGTLELAQLLEPFGLRLVELL